MGTDPAESAVAERRLARRFLTLGARVTALFLSFVSSIIIARSLGALGAAVSLSPSRCLARQFGTLDSRRRTSTSLRRTSAVNRILANSLWLAAG